MDRSSFPSRQTDLLHILEIERSVIDITSILLYMHFLREYAIENTPFKVKYVCDDSPDGACSSYKRPKSAILPPIWRENHAVVKLPRSQ